MEKDQLLNNYLDDQQAAGAVNDDGEEGVLQTMPEAPTTEELDQFKTKVRNWMEIDNTVKKLRGVIRERNTAKTDLTKQILEFMGKFNIEDLNTKEGKLRYKVSNVKAPVTKQTLKERLIQNYSPEMSADDLAKMVFDTPRATVEKHSLKRLQPPRVLNIN